MGQETAVEFPNLTQHTVYFKRIEIQLNLERKVKVTLDPLALPVVFLSEGDCLF